jgi:starch synthase (maltosyl-transferring)
MGPRVYNLFPPLAGPIAAWPAHFERIAAMGFDWAYLNPIYATGGSGSLYAVADYGRINPLLRGRSEASDDDLVRAFVVEAGERGLSIMLDLVANHTANDAPLVAEHPDWYERDAEGALVAPRAVDPDDPTAVTVWGDLARLDYDGPARAEIVAFFCDVVRRYVRLGVRGFRCDAAYQVPAGAWAEILAAARAEVPGVVFAAETLGGPPNAVASLANARFDYVFNSAKWWDFRAPWLLELYDESRTVAPSIAFPESHDTPRLIADLGLHDDEAIRAAYEQRYAFAATFSSGVMMPMGYEFGFAKPLDVVRTRPNDWETPRFDLSPFVARINALKAEIGAYNEEGAQRALAGAGDAVALVRRGLSAHDAAVAAFNPRADAVATLDRAALIAALDGTPDDVTPPSSTMRGDADRNGRLVVPPLGFRLFRRAAAQSAIRERATDPLPSGPVVIEAVEPQVDGGRFPVKRVVGDRVTVEATIFRDGHDAIAAVLRYRAADEPAWHETPLVPLGNDRWRGSFAIERTVRHAFTIDAWPDAFASWRADVAKKRDAGDLGDAESRVDVRAGRALVAAAVDRAQTDDDRAALAARFAAIDAAEDLETRVRLLLDDGLAALVARAPDRTRATRFVPTLAVDVDRPAARFAAWYELFPRSQSPVPGRHGTFADAARRLPALRAMGFDVVYLPPIHPIGTTARKGRNNALAAAPGDPGSPWAIGSAHGGHTAIEPALGTLAEFDAFVAAARAQDLEVALDLALQCSPDHPWVREHPEWFSFRDDGTLRHAENPPKKYQDIVNFAWDGPQAASLWRALRDVVGFWLARGIRTFRVDNPHTKPFAFWEWLIANVRAEHPEAIFLAEAFTRPAQMDALAKRGFAQSYTYFTWRTTKGELTEYARDLALGPRAEFFRPNFWPNTPDILPTFLQTGGRPAFRIRLVLAATLASAYGIYSGYELCENAALPGREEYADSEKFELRQRVWNAPGNIVADVAQINAIRRANPALHDWRNLTFLRADDDAVLFYAKRSGGNVVLVAVTLDPFAPRDAVLWMPTGDLGLADDEPYEVEELLAGTRHVWCGSPQRWRFDPERNPAAVFRLDLAVRERID